MNKFEYILNHIYYSKEYPLTWNELSRDQLLFVSHLMTRNLTKEVFNTLVLRNFLNLDKKKIATISGNEMLKLGKSIDFIFEKKELTINKIPVLTIRKRFKKYTLYGPQDGMINLTHEQYFGHCEAAHDDYIETENIDSLNYLIASLYTFEKHKFNPDDVEKIKYLVEKLPVKYKMAIIFFYIGVKSFFAYKYPKLFVKTKSKNGIQKSDLYFIQITDQLNNNVLANNEAVKQSNILEAFQRLTKMIEESEEFKRKQNERNRHH